MAFAERDGLVADAGDLRALAAAEALAPDASAADDGDVFEVLTPDEAVVEVAVAEVLIGVELVGLGEVVAAGLALRGSVGGDECGAGVELEVDVALEVDGIGEEIAGGKTNGSAAGGGGGVDGFVDGVGVERSCRRRWRRRI